MKQVASVLKGAVMKTYITTKWKELRSRILQQKFTVISNDCEKAILATYSKQHACGCGNQELQYAITREFVGCTDDEFCQQLHVGRILSGKLLPDGCADIDYEKQFRQQRAKQTFWRALRTA
jgi:hypothetical protein